MRRQRIADAALWVALPAMLAIAACSKPEPPPAAPAPEPVPEQAALPEPSTDTDGWTKPAPAAASPAPAIRIVGTVHYRNLEGGLFVIRDAEGTQYNPLNLPDEFRVDGLSVEVEARRRDDVASIGMVGPMIEVLRIRKRMVAEAAPVAAEPTVAEMKPAVLVGTAWRLDELAGATVEQDSRATLEFPEEGRANGNGSCNRFNGVVSFDGDTIKFGGIAATRMACAEAVMKQEDAYFAALQDAERFELDGHTLRIYAAGRTEPLRFAAAEAPKSRSGISAASAPPVTTSALTGIWTVVAHHVPGTSALSGGEASARHGETVRLTGTAISPGQRCREPGYSTSRVAGDSWLASEFKLARGSLKPLAGRDQIQVLRVSCAGQSWTALGGILLEVDANRALAPWDGVFYELKRDRDFRAVGQEPGWQLEIRKGSEMRFIYDYGRNMAVTPAPKAQVGSGSGTQTYHAVAEANDLTVVIVPVSCTDTMSGKSFPATVSVTLNGRTFRGCGEELATPFQG